MKSPHYRLIDVEWQIRNIMPIMGMDGTPLSDLEKPRFDYRNMCRCIFDGRYKFVRYFGANGYNTPDTLEALFANNDVGLYDLESDPGELDNLADRGNPAFDEGLLGEMNAKLNQLVQDEIGEDISVLELVKPK